MDNGTILQELNPIFADVLDQPDIQLSSESNASSVDGWDSLAHINLIVAIEKRYHIKFALGELQDLRNLGEMVELIRHKTGG